MRAGVLLCARTLAGQLALALPCVGEILAATGATRSCAYEIAREIGDLLPTLARRAGRPRAEPVPAPANEIAAICAEALRFVMCHPGCVRLGGERGCYGDAWRLFVISLRERHLDVPLCDLADAILTPLGTIEDWLRATPLEAPLRASDAKEPATDGENDAKISQIETVLAAYRSWRGSFGAFCEHVRRDHRLELGKTLVASILFAHGARVPKRRGGRSRDEDALRGAFETFFPGAQWVGDGKALDVGIDGKPHRVNLELVVDAASGAAVGVAVRDEEDSQAVTDVTDESLLKNELSPKK